MTSAPRGANLVPASLLVVGLLARAILIPRLNLNWDEFSFLEKLASHERGALSARLLTFHVHLIAPVRLLADPIDQLLALRSALWAASLVVAGAVVVLGRRLTGSLSAGLWAAALLQGFSYYQHFGQSVRYDPFILTPAIVAVALLVREHRRHRAPDVVAGALLGLSLLLSIKAVFYAPVVIGALLFQGLQRSWREALHQLTFAVAGLISSVVLLGGFHLWSLAPVVENAIPATTGAPSSDFLAILAAVVRDLGQLPQPHTLTLTLRWDAWLWLLMLAGLAVVVVGAVRQGSRIDKARLALALGLVAPLGSLAFYRNSYPYFFVTIIPFAVVIVAASFATVETALRQRPTILQRLLPAVLALPVVFAGARFLAFNHEDRVSHQRAVVAGVRAIFPTPAPYLDRCALVGDHPMVGPFMSTWGIETLRRRAAPVFIPILQQQAPHYVVADVSAFRLERPVEKLTSGPRALRADDVAALKASFRQVWGPVWVAGFTVSGPQIRTVFVPGVYRITGDGEVSIDDVVHRGGDVVQLTAGEHRFVAGDEAGTFTFTIADAVLSDAAMPPPPAGEIFDGLFFRRGPRPTRRDRESTSADGEDAT